MSWQDAVERTVSGLGYDLVDATRSAGGLLRVFIDHPAEASGAGVHTGAAGADEKFITVDDCEKVNRQLQHVLEVDDIAYERLEVSSPGLDRPLKKAADFARFVGEQVEVTLKLPFKGRKKYVGALAPQGDGWRLLLVDTRAVRPAKAGPAKGASGKGGASTHAGPMAEAAAALNAPASDLALDFSLDEVREAHLVPVVDFKGRRTAPRAAGGTPGFALPEAGAGPNDEVDGGRIQ